MLRAVRSMLHAELPERWARVADASHWWRKLPFALLLAALLIFGCFPRLLTDKIKPSAWGIVQMANPVIARIAPDTAAVNGSVPVAKESVALPVQARFVQ
jgi:hypothetical protein